MPERVRDKVAVITGAAQGIGFGCARVLAVEGARIVLVDIDAAKGQHALKQLRDAGHEALFVQADMGNEQDCKDIIAATLQTYEQLDILVNNAGMFPRATLEETTTELWDRVMNVNLRGAFYCCKYAIPAMKTRGGSIVNVGSINGIQGLPNLVAYSASKGGLLALTRTLAGAYAADGIRVNYVLPGWILTEGEIALHKDHGISEEALWGSGKTLPLGRHQTVEDVGYAILYLASDESAQVTGAVLNVDAGLSMLPLQPRPSYGDTL
jgi:NAD(P)-dependent dehydrogenase (short-subunit alcohol dehydrogenase family)